MNTHDLCIFIWKLLIFTALKFFIILHSNLKLKECISALQEMACIAIFMLGNQSQRPYPYH